MTVSLDKVMEALPTHKASADPRSPTPTAGMPVSYRQNQKLQGQVIELQLKVKDLRSKLDEEVQARKKAEGWIEDESAGEENDNGQ
jgi:hypothetical protein